MRTYNDALKYLEQLCQFGVKEGLERTKKLAAALDNPQNFYRTIHVTGTNGKGSVCAMLAEMLKLQGLRVGLFTSPHLESYCERIRIYDGKNYEASNPHGLRMDAATNFKTSKRYGATAVCQLSKSCGENISEADFAEMIFRVKNSGVEATHFETLTLAAFEYFKIRAVDVAVVEVGMGGTFDSTNIIAPELCIITTVALDHENILGDLNGIARNKAGIIRANVPTVTGVTAGEQLEIIRAVAKEKNSPLYEVTTPANVKINLRGEYQKFNAAIAIKAAQVLGIDDEKIYSALAHVEWPGRFEIFKNSSGVIVIDGAHNPHGATALRESLDKNFPHGKRIWVFGVLADKNFAEMIKILFRAEDFVIVTPPNSERAASTEIICKNLREHAINCVAVENNFEAVERLKNLTGDVKIIAGSLYLIGAVRHLICERQET
ncbi:MAG: bifunctional folylpolyglutamate synthase/dihydrofolate synthase [Selenomonadaceae bacterium]|nr:bifunctional folylpolyglutamate synthase/dihydrofolate synthase [Selenomonadaceae bacterium]